MSCSTRRTFTHRRFRNKARFFQCYHLITYLFISRNKVTSLRRICSSRFPCYERAQVVWTQITCGEEILARYYLFYLSRVRTIISLIPYYHMSEGLLIIFIEYMKMLFFILFFKDYSLSHGTTISTKNFSLKLLIISLSHYVIYLGLLSNLVLHFSF